VSTTTAPAPHTVADPVGYLVHLRQGAAGLLVIENYRNDGLLTSVIEAATATDGYTSVLAAGLVSRLDHAIYLGCDSPAPNTPCTRAPATRKTPHPGDRAGGSGHGSGSHGGSSHRQTWQPGLPVLTSLPVAGA
jgi:hypothetical protein